MRLTIDVAAAGSYRLKFYTTTYDLNLDATASLASAGVSDTVAGTYESASTEKYEYTVEFSTEGADTLTLDLVRSGGSSTIFAYEAFSLQSLGGGGGSTYTITFVNVDGSQTSETVSEGEVATPPTGVNTSTRTFTAWPTIVPATADATYTALYDDDNGGGGGSGGSTYTITFINVDESVTTQTVSENEVATPPTGVDTDTRTFTGWPTVAPATEDATYAALYDVDLGPADVTWDGGGADALWTTAANWSGDALPSNGQTVAISNGDTVEIPANYWDLSGGLTVNVAGNSDLYALSNGARLFGGSTFNFFAGSGLTGTFFYLDNVTLDFEDGAIPDPQTIEHNTAVTYAFTSRARASPRLRRGICVRSIPRTGRR